MFSGKARASLVKAMTGLEAVDFLPPEKVADACDGTPLNRLSGGEAKPAGPKMVAAVLQPGEIFQPGGWIRRLSVRLTLWHTVLFLVSALVLLSLTYVLLSNRALAAERYLLESRMNHYRNEYARGGTGAVQALASLRKGRAQKAYYVRLADKDGRVLFQREPEDWSEFPLRDLALRPLPEAGEREWETLHSTDGAQLLVLGERLADGAVLQIGKSNEELRSLLADYRRTSLLGLLILLPVTFAGGAFMASRALRPVGQVTGVAREIVETGRFDARVPAPCSGDEIDAMVRVFNRMLGRIEALIRELRDSIDNVAHDLRTPITRLRHKAQAAIESAQDRIGTGQCPHCEVQLDALAECLEEADRVSTMLNTLMDIAEADAGLVKLAPQCFEVIEVTVRAVDSYMELADEKEIAVQYDVPWDLRVRADEIAISRVFANILDNAIKYTPRGGRVDIVARADGEDVVIDFRDTGAGIPAEDLPHIWDRLFRSDRSRTERGLGLGLSFVQALVRAHHGSVAAASTPGEGTTITLRLPGAPAGGPGNGELGAELSAGAHAGNTGSPASVVWSTDGRN